ncbi:MAG: arginase family protein [Ignavibacteriales bacterium]|nr:arginase family protein [Ignavibacteriales bacterium]
MLLRLYRARGQPRGGHRPGRPRRRRHVRRHGQDLRPDREGRGRHPGQGRRAHRSRRRPLHHLSRAQGLRPRSTTPRRPPLRRPPGPLRRVSTATACRTPAPSPASSRTGWPRRLVQVGVRAVERPSAGARPSSAASGMIEMKEHRRPAPPAGSPGPVYVSFDLDALDPAFAPGVSHHEPGGPHDPPGRPGHPVAQGHGSWAWTSSS